jgi:formylglycine-generating enzyme required for sulfatase activity
MARIVLDPEAPAEGRAKPEDVAFCIDTHEFPGAGARPKTGVSSSAASSQCRKAGKALCTGAQWMKACEASPPKASACNTSGRLQESGAAPECVTADGVFDLIGNAGEWAADGRLHGGDGGVGGQGACDYATKRFSPKSTDGFRCCAKPALP